MLLQAGGFSFFERNSGWRLAVSSEVKGPIRFKVLHMQRRHATFTGHREGHFSPSLVCSKHRGGLLRNLRAACVSSRMISQVEWQQVVRYVTDRRPREKLVPQNSASGRSRILPPVPPGGGYGTPPVYCCVGTLTLLVCLKFPSPPCLYRFLSFFAF